MTNHDPHFALFIEVHVGYCDGQPAKPEGEEHEMQSRVLRFDAEMPEQVQGTLNAIGIPWPPTDADEQAAAQFSMNLAISRMLQQRMGSIPGIRFVPTAEDLAIEEQITDVITSFQIPEPKTREQMD